MATKRNALHVKWVGNEDTSEESKSEGIGVHRWKLCFPEWSRQRYMLAALGCLSSSIVLTVRLLLDLKPTAYLIHSIIVFLDMILIHLFTNSLWLSVSGEIITYVSVLAFHVTKETLYELTETTMIAALCSFHLIASRSKIIEEREELKENVKELERRGSVLLRNIQLVQDLYLKEIEEEDNETSDFIEHADENIDDEESGAELKRDLVLACSRRDLGPGVMTRVQKWMHRPLKEKSYKDTMRCIGEKFFEHFLDGSAGVMYTSFLGLILDEILSYGSSKDY